VNTLRDNLPELPPRMRALPIDERGYPVPWFVAWINGKPDFRVADQEKAQKARYFGHCWVCGNQVGKFKTFVIGPMCAVNRTTAEPPCHLDCATFSATACPFLTLPKAQRRDANMPADYSDPAGIMIERNPGVTCLWTTLSYSLWNAGNGLLYELSEPTNLAFYTQKRIATREEVLASIDSGMPILRELAEREGEAASAELQRRYKAMLMLLPAA
jgi:hypothetical protein